MSCRRCGWEPEVYTEPKSSGPSEAARAFRRGIAVGAGLAGLLVLLIWGLLWLAAGGR